MISGIEEGFAIFGECAAEMKDLYLNKNRFARQNFYSLISPEVNSQYQGQPWLKGIPFVRPTGTTTCEIIGYLREGVLHPE